LARRRIMLGDWLRGRTGRPAVGREQHRPGRGGPFVDDQNILAHVQGRAEAAEIFNLFGGSHLFADHFEH
jgi:hypothetical protein